MPTTAWGKGPHGGGGGGGGGGGIFGRNFLAKGIFFFTKITKNWHFWAKLSSVFENFLLTREYLTYNS